MIDGADERSADAETQYEGALRTGGSVTVTSERLLVERPDEPSVAVSLSDVVEVTVQDVDWFLVVMSLGLVGFGAASLGRNAVAGAGFVLAGAVSTYLTYRKRNALRVSVAGRTKPLKLYPEAPERVADALAPETGE
jgi:hypothetical protein